MDQQNLLGIGLYTPAEAGRLLSVSPSKITRWLKGHNIANKAYKPLWKPQVQLEDGSICLGFRDLMEMRTASAFIQAGLSPQAVRRAIELARAHIDDERPLSTTVFKTDGKTVFLELAAETSDPGLLDIFKGQYVFGKIIERSLKNVEFEGISPSRWWVGSKRNKIVIDPQRSFGQPIDDDSGVPTRVLAEVGGAAASISKAARDWDISENTIRRAMEFEASLTRQAA